MIMRILATIGTICAGGAIILVIVAIVAAVKETLREKKERKYIYTEDNNIRYEAGNTADSNEKILCVRRLVHCSERR